MNEFMNALRGQAAMAAAGGNSLCAEVTSYDPNTYAVKVTLQPSGTESGWLPLKSPWVGNGWGMFCPPSIGDIVELDSQEGDDGSLNVGWRFYNDTDRPLNVESGEFWLVHKSGSFLKFRNDGNVEVKSNKDLTATVGGKLTATVQGDAKVNAQGTVILTGGGLTNSKGIVQGDCICALTGKPHVMVADNVKGSM